MHLESSSKHLETSEHRNCSCLCVNQSMCVQVVARRVHMLSVYKMLNDDDNADGKNKWPLMHLANCSSQVADRHFSTITPFRPPAATNASLSPFPSSFMSYYYCIAFDKSNFMAQQQFI